MCRSFPCLIINFAACVYVAYPLVPGQGPLSILGEPFFIDPELRLERLLAMSLALVQKKRGLRCCLQFSPDEFYYCDGRHGVRPAAAGPAVRVG